MCGIAGLISGKHAERIKAMTDIMTYRGPDDAGFYSDDVISLGQRRLSINGVADGHQPIANEKGDILLLCNGEIYNSPDLRRQLIAKGHTFRTSTDVEVILHLYEEKGEDCFADLRGMFGAAIWDAPNRRLLLARDHMGQKPVFFATRGADIAFASEPKSVLEAGLLDREIDLEALWHYMSLRYMPDDRSLFKGVKKLPAATYAVWEHGKVRTKRYWKLDTFRNKLQGTEQELTDALDKLLLETVEMHLLSDVPVGTFLSGGIDSSLITAMTAKITGKKFNTFSIGVNDQINELPWAEKIAKQYNLDWRTETVEANLVDMLPEMIFHMDEPADPFGVGVYLVSQVAAKYDKVVLSGDGGDENFAGYDRFAGQKLARLYGLIPGFLRRGVMAPVIGLIPESFGYKSIAGKLRWLNDVGGHAKTPGDAYARSMSVLRFTQEQKDALFTDRAVRQIADTDSVHQILKFFDDGTANEYLDKMLYTDLMTRIPDQLLAITDRMSMAHSIEVRPPLIDYKVTEFAASLPCSIKLRGTGRGLKYILRNVAKRYMGADLVDRPKQGFGFPIAKWLRGDLAAFQRNLFKQSRFVELGLFRQEEIERLMEEHIGGKADHNFRLWILINLEIWYRMCFERKSIGEMKEFIAKLRS
ncbi:MAG: asparagine synthase (glutamine-hydrolyzing) [Kiritimatiellae bacterium]|nr:asparagine synthase (glutamine-hydrolyzing) [Kiritimatiellia bacterium]